MPVCDLKPTSTSPLGQLKVSCVGPTESPMTNDAFALALETTDRIEATARASTASDRRIGVLLIRSDTNTGLPRNWFTGGPSLLSGLHLHVRPAGRILPTCGRGV